MRDRNLPERLGEQAEPQAGLGAGQDAGLDMGQDANQDTAQFNGWPSGKQQDTAIEEAMSDDQTVVDACQRQVIHPHVPCDSRREGDLWIDDRHGHVVPSFTGVH